jgi:hypothetical protein
MRYIPLVALLLYQTIAIGAEELPALKAQVTTYNAPPIILAQQEEQEEDEGTGAEAGCDENTTEAECAAAPDCTWTDDECVDVVDDEDE